MTISGLQAAARNNIAALGTLNASLGRSQTRLATGQRYAGVVENPAAVFDARDMRGRSEHLQTIVDGYSRSRGAIATASSGLDAISSLVGQLETLARRIEQATPADIGTPAIPSTPASGPQTLTVYTKQINRDGQGNVVAGNAKTVAERAILGPWQASEFLAGQIKDDIFANNARAYVPHVTSRESTYTPAQKDTRVDRIRITATDGTTTTSHDFYIGHASDRTIAQLDADLAAGSDDVYTVKQLVQGINRELGGFLKAEVTANGRIQFEAAGDFSAELIEKSPGPGTSTKPWDSLINLFGTVDASGDGDVTTGLGTFEFSAGTGSAANYDNSANADGNYAITFNPGTRPTGGFAAVVPSTPGSAATGLLKEWDALVGQIEQVGRDAGYDGLNLLLDGDTIRLSERSTAARLSLGGLSASISALGIARSAADFSTPTAIADRLGELRGATDRLNAMGQIVSSASAIVDAREDFSLDLRKVLETGADKLTLIDANEESAKLLAAQTRIDLASSALTISSRARPFLLQHFDRTQRDRAF